MSEALSFTELESTAKSATSETQTTTEETATTTTAVEDSKPQFTEADVTAYQALVAAGITPETAEQFKQAKTAMDNLPSLLKNNPDALLDEIQKNDPALHDELITRISDRWFEQKGKTRVRSTPEKERQREQSCRIGTGPTSRQARTRSSRDEG